MSQQTLLHLPIFWLYTYQLIGMNSISHRPESNTQVDGPPSRHVVFPVIVTYFRRLITSGISSRSGLMLLLAICMAMTFGSVITAAVMFPNGYSWHSQVISKLSSPQENPQAYWLPVAGISISMLVALPFAGYITRPLIEVSPRCGKSAFLALCVGLVVMSVAMIVQVLDTIITHRKVHTYLAHAGTFTFFIGMGFCCVCAALDRKDRKLLPGLITPIWFALTFGPMLFLLPMGIIRILGKNGFIWAEQFRQSFRDTPLWHLAFWEWMATAICTVFAIISAIYIPEPAAQKDRARQPKAPASLAKADAY
jgi:hypothetical protein